MSEVLRLIAEHAKLYWAKAPTKDVNESLARLQEAAKKVKAC